MARRRTGRSYNYRKKQGGWAWLKNIDWGSVLNLGVQAYGAYSSNKAGKDAQKQAGQASAAEERLLGTQADLAEVNNARAQEMYDEYMDTALPAQREVLSLASKKINPNVEAAHAGADYSLADATQRGTRRRSLSAAGVDPSSGVAQEGDRLALLDSTAGRAAAMTTARRGATDLRLGRMQNAVQGFSPLLGMVPSFSGQANSGLASTARAYGANADAASAVAGAAGQETGESLAAIADQFQRWSAPKQKPVVTGG